MMSMKNIINKLKIIYWVLPAVLILGFASCKKNDVGTGAPTVARVRLLNKSDTTTGVVRRVTLDSSVTGTLYSSHKFDSTVVAGRYNTQYAIVGNNLATTTNLQLNGISVYFNPALLTDNSIIFTVPNTIPFAGQSNKLTVTTKYGKVDFSFPILQPPPQVTSFAPLAGSAGDTLTIAGTVLDGATAVKFGLVAATAVSAKIVSNTSTQIKVVIPTGIVQAYIFVTTAGGTSQSVAQFGFKALIYDDAFANGWGNYTGYGSTLNFNNTVNVKRGTHAISVVVGNGYGALQIGYGGATLNSKTAGLTAVKFSIYGGNAIVAGDKALVVINGDYAHGFIITLKAGAYTDYTVPLSSLGNPGDIKEFVIQAQGIASPSTFYVDDIGFI